MTRHLIFRHAEIQHVPDNFNDSFGQALRLAFSSTFSSTFGSTFGIAMPAGTAIVRPFSTDNIPELIIPFKLSGRIRRLFKNVTSFLDLRILQELLWNFPSSAHLRKITKPKNLHLLFREVVRLELRQFDEYQMQTFNNSVGMLYIDHIIMVVVFF